VFNPKGRPPFVRYGILCDQHGRVPDKKGFCCLFFLFHTDIESYCIRPLAFFTLPIEIVEVSPFAATVGMISSRPKTPIEFALVGKCVYPLPTEGRK